MGIEERRKDEDRRRARRVAFAENLQAILDAQKLTHRDFAALNGWPNHTRLYPWLRGHAEPEPDQVFAMEDVLKLEPGTLSRPLGYVPAEISVEPAATWEQVVDGMALLDDRTKRALKVMVRELVQPETKAPPVRKTGGRK